MSQEVALEKTNVELCLVPGVGMLYLSAQRSAPKLHLKRRLNECS